jgi:hypothetical protein
LFVADIVGCFTGVVVRVGALAIGGGGGGGSTSEDDPSLAASESFLAASDVDVIGDNVRSGRIVIIVIVLLELVLLTAPIMVVRELMSVWS